MLPSLSVELKLQGFVEASAISFNSCLSPIECNTHVYREQTSCGVVDNNRMFIQRY